MFEIFNCIYYLNLGVHLAQGLNYLVAYKLDKGLLINFGAQSLEVKRLRHPKNKQNS